MSFWKKVLAASFCFLICCLLYAQSTEITLGSTKTDRSLGIEIDLPTLECHARHTGYKQVTWIKDYATVKKGPNKYSSHVLSLQSLLNSTKTPILFDSALKLQGYYWCETDHTISSTIHDYLFRIKEIHTFVGKFVATNDYFEGSGSSGLQDELTEKMLYYENQLESELFFFLQPVSIHVTNIKALEKGLEVRFFLYDLAVIHPRKPYDSEMAKDEDRLLDIREYLRNDSPDVEPVLYDRFRNWTDRHGIKLEDIDLRSTLGCYEERYKMPYNTSEEVIWPYARIGEVVIPENACSSKNGLSVTRMCTGSFFQGAVWGVASESCERTAEGVTLQLKNMYNEFGNEKRAHYIRNLNKLMRHPDALHVTDLYISTEILKKLSVLRNLDHQEMNGILEVIDQIVDANRTELIVAKNNIRLTSRILQIFKNLLESASNEKKEVKISKRHIIVDTKYTNTSDRNNPILGLAVISPSIHHGTLRNGSIEFVTGKSKLPQHDSIAYFAIPPQLIHERESSLGYPCQINMVFFKEWYLFQNPKSALLKRNHRVLPTPVMYVSLSGEPVWNSTDPVHLYFKHKLDEQAEKPVCVHYDPEQEDGAGAWSTEGCEYKGLKSGYHHCECHHLSIFAVVLSQSPDSSHMDEKLKLGTSVYVACGVSMLALSLAVLLFILSKNWRMTIDHSILFCLSLTFLACIIIIFISEMYFTRRAGCIALAMVLHHTIFSIFGWLTVLAIIYRLRFAKKTDVGEIPHFMFKAALPVWGLPTIIVVIMWLSREYPCGEDNCWATVADVSKEALIPLVLLILITLCINLCATVSLTGRFKKDFLIGDSSYNDVAVKFRVSFTIFFFFVLSWLFGFFALHERSQTLRILFSISITLTAYYVTLFFMFQEVSFWDLCHRYKRKTEPEEEPTVQYQGKPYTTVNEHKHDEK